MRGRMQAIIDGVWQGMDRMTDTTQAIGAAQAEVERAADALVGLTRDLVRSTRSSSRTRR